MATLWFCIVAFMLAMYVVFDGFDLGAGAVHRLVARTPEERRAVLRSIGPVWDGNEVWLLAAGGVLYFAFPPLYAASFSGFYLPLMMVLWMLIGRGVSLELRNHVDSGVWKGFWDGIFTAASGLLCIFYGAALGNVVRGVPLDPQGRFFLPMWSDFRLGPPSGILDWYTVVIGVAALVVLAQHGSLWITLKVDGAVGQRARRLTGWLWWGAIAVTALVTLVSWAVQPQIRANLSAHPAGWIFPLLAVAGLAGIGWFRGRRQDLKAFLSSALYIVGMLTSAAFGLYPYVLPSRTDPALGLTIDRVAAPAYGLQVGLFWWVPGMILVAIYFTYVYRHFAGKVHLDEPGY
jgi:cytochrome bd ubiquinol oxidase subunit II